MIQLSKELSYLLGYPYGCMEQTISKAFPQLYFAEVLKTMGKPGTYFVRSGESDLNPTYTVQEAIRRVESMQLADGGFSMWPGLPTEDGWASAYAVHFLTEARRAGFEVSPSVYSKALGSPEYPHEQPRAGGRNHLSKKPATRFVKSSAGRTCTVYTRWRWEDSPTARR
jgi:uncharacterized protein YfaS (alpha-2-macroglobulin family)